MAKRRAFAYIRRMAATAIFLMIVGMGATVGILVMGLYSMVRGGDFNAKWGNRLMRMRIAAQAFAIAMFMLGVYLLRQSG